MDAQTGVLFLSLLVQQEKATEGDIEKAIEIAGSKSPSASFKVAQRYFVLQHGTSVQDGYLGFAKGTRWLAIIRRDEGQEAFESKASELRELFS